MSTFDMRCIQDLLDLAITKMQSCANRLTKQLEVLQDPPKDDVTDAEVKAFVDAVELLSDGLEKDSLCIQELADKVNKGRLEENPSDDPGEEVSQPPFSPENEFLSVAEHIEQFWGVDYDSDA